MNTPPPAPKSEPPPRAFSQGTGLLMQVAGVLFFFLGCCACAGSGAWDPVPGRGQTYERIAENEAVTVTAARLFEEPGRAGMLLSMIAASFGGLGLAGFGLGLQSDRAGAAGGALAVSLAMSALLLAGGAGLWMSGRVGEPVEITRFGRVLLALSPAWPARLVHGLATAVSLGITALAAGAWREHRRDPPPAGPQVLPEDFDYEDPLARR